MRDFSELQRELGLKPFLESGNGNLYFIPSAPGAQRMIVRRFDRDLPPTLIPAYAGLLAAAQAWIDDDPELNALVRVEQPVEVGSDFIARTHYLGNSLDQFLDTDPEEDRPEPPDELATMQSRFRERAGAARGPRAALLTAVLARSLLEPTGKTLYSYRGVPFTVVDLKPTRDELERWSRLATDS